MPESREPEPCGRLMVGSGTDTYDPVCELPVGHDGSCWSTAAIDQHRLAPRSYRLAPPSYPGSEDAREGDDWGGSAL